MLKSVIEQGEEYRGNVAIYSFSDTTYKMTIQKILSIVELRKSRKCEIFFLFIFGGVRRFTKYEFLDAFYSEKWYFLRMIHYVMQYLFVRY